MKHRRDDISAGSDGGCHSLSSFSPHLQGRPTFESISRHLYAADLPDPDFNILTSGEVLLSGFSGCKACIASITFRRFVAGHSQNRPLVGSYQERIRRFGR
jgi:undecaprenyl pyrophosphate synthase